MMRTISFAKARRVAPWGRPTALGACAAALLALFLAVPPRASAQEAGDGDVPGVGAAAEEDAAAAPGAGETTPAAGTAVVVGGAPTVAGPAAGGGDVPEVAPDPDGEGEGEGGEGGTEGEGDAEAAGRRDGPAEIIERFVPDVLPKRRPPSPRELRRAMARGTKAQVERVRAYHLEALRAYYARRFALAADACKRALEIEPDNLAIQKLMYDAEWEQQAHQLKMDAQRQEYLDNKALAEVDYHSAMPDRLPPEFRPKLPLWSERPVPEGLRRMQELLNQRVSMNFVEADLSYVLQTLFKISGVDIIADFSVMEDKVLSLQVENVSLRGILDFIRRNFEGISYTVTEDAVWLTTPEKPPLVTRSYPLTRGLVGQANFGSGVRSSSSRGGGGLGQSQSQGRRQQPQRRQPAQQQQGQSGSGTSYLEDTLGWVETWEDLWPVGSQWWLDRQTNTLFVVTTEEMHGRIEEILAVMDVTPIQILVRCKFVEILTSDLRELGLETLMVGYMDKDDGIVGGIGDEAFGEGGSGFQVMYQGMLSNYANLSVALRALMTQKRTKVLSAPQIIALNNETAEIDVSKTFSYASQYQSIQQPIYTQGGNTMEYSGAFVPSQWQDVDVGFFMEFVPSVGRDMKTIFLDLHARVDDVVGGTDRFQQTPIIAPGAPPTEEGQDPTGQTAADLYSQYAGGGSGGVSVQRPVIDSREFRTRLVVQDGGTIIIGGLLKNYVVDLKKRVPIIGDIPLIGLLFRYRKKVKEQSNLMIIVQAEIVRPDGGTYTDELGPGGEFGRPPPAYGVQSYGSPPRRREWMGGLTPDIEREVLRSSRRLR